MADYTLSDLNAVSAIAEDDLLHVRNTSGLDKKITWADLRNLMNPVGTIKMFDGALWVDNVTIVGWYACIAANAGQGCPNLVDQFIKGGTTATVLDTGGAATVTLAETHLPSHTHSLSSHTHEGAAHTHTSAAHTHTLSSHTHEGAAHTHTSAAHTHNLSSHTHVGAAHTHSITHDHGAATTGSHDHYQGIEWDGIDVATVDVYGVYSRTKVNNSYATLSTDTTYNSSSLVNTQTKSVSVNLPSFSGTSGARSASTSGGPSDNTSGSTTPNATGGRSASTSGGPSNNTSGSTTPGVTGGRSASTSGAPSNNTSGTGSGSGSAHNNEPQYYKLIFIRKCS